MLERDISSFVDPRLSPQLNLILLHLLRYPLFLFPHRNASFSSHPDSSYPTFSDHLPSPSLTENPKISHFSIFFIPDLAPSLEPFVFTVCLFRINFLLITDSKGCCSKLGLEMVGGGSRREEAPVINSTNVFAALGSLKKKKKKPEKEEGSSKTRAEEPEKKEVFWAPAPLTAKSWADVDDDDDDDYYATTAPPESVWGAPAAVTNSETVIEKEAAVEESESELEGLDDVEDDAEDEHENDLEVPVEAEPVLKKPPEPSLATKETERQLSKKELKKKELEELEAVLAELGYSQRESSGHDDSHGGEKKEEDHNGEVEKKENATGESKNAKKKKKKDKSSKELKESQDQPDGVDVGNTTSETAGMEKAEDASVTDVKERLKKVASIKKKKSSKEMDAAARAAASEAAARNARLAAAKKKEKAHYNQQPVR